MSFNGDKTAEHASTPSGSIPGLYEDRELDLDTTGKATFDYDFADGSYVKPRLVTKLDWFIENSGDLHEYVIIKVHDALHEGYPLGEAWIRFKVYSGVGFHGDLTHLQDLIVPRDSAKHASIKFVNGIDYQDVVKMRQKMAWLFFYPADQQRPSRDAPSSLLHLQKTRSYRTGVFIGMLSQCIGEGVGICKPKDLCEIWSSLADLDRRLYGFRWYKLEDGSGPDGSGVEYLILQFSDASDDTSSGNWWVRIKGTELDEVGDSVTPEALALVGDEAAISANPEGLIHAGSELKHEMSFKAGVPFDKVANVLRSIEFDPIADASESYASSIAYRLSMESGDNLCECRTADLCKIWEDGSQMLVNRMQCLKRDDGVSPEYLLINVSVAKQDTRRTWVRFGVDATSGRDEHWAWISQNRRLLVEENPGMGGPKLKTVIDFAFDDLRLGQVTREFRSINRNVDAQNPIRTSPAFQPVKFIRDVLHSTSMFPGCESGGLGKVQELLEHWDPSQ